MKKIAAALILFAAPCAAQTTVPGTRNGGACHDIE